MEIPETKEFGQTVDERADSIKSMNLTCPALGIHELFHFLFIILDYL